MNTRNAVRRSKPTFSIFNRRTIARIALFLAPALVLWGAWRSRALRAAPQGGASSTPSSAGSKAGRAPASLRLKSLCKGSIQPGETRAWEIGSLIPGSLYSVEVSLGHPSALTPLAELAPRKIASPITFNVDKSDIYPSPAAVEINFESPGNPAISKKLHSGDPGSYFIFRAAEAAPATLTLSAPAPGAGHGIGFELEVRPLVVSAADAVQIAPNTASDWKHASPMTLGKTVYGTSDDIEYLYNTDEGKNGWQWLTFDYKDSKPKLVFFELDILDRDVPCSMKFYREETGPNGPHLAEYKRGKDPAEIRHDDQNDDLLDFKFITRVLTPGSYYLAVKANHPAWSLHTTLFDVPPYQDPRQAVKVAMRYMVDIADSWFSNTPRKGAVRTRAENVTDETERCVACHAGHFPMLSTLTAIRNGYTVRNVPEFKFMIDKLYNAPAPFYGFKKTYWLRFELAPANGLSRLTTMLLMYEDLVSHRATETPAEAVNYLRLVYDARQFLPRADHAHYIETFQPTRTRNFEFDGNRPISDFRVATDSWFVLDHVARRTHDPAVGSSAAHVEDLMTSDHTNDLEDMVEQTKGMVLMMRRNPALTTKFEPIVQDNIRKILARQHTDGGWVTAEYLSNEQFFEAAARAPFEKPTDPSLQFMTGEVLYTLKLAGYNMQDPRVQKAIHWLLGLQRDFGGWLDNKGELFLLPQLETSWAVMGLSQIYPERGPALASPSPPPAYLEGPLAARQVAQLPVVPTLEWLSAVWRDHNPRHLKIVLALLNCPEPLIRRAAAAAVGRMAVDAPAPAPFEAAVAPLVAGLGDRAKMVSRAAAWSLRQLGNDGVGIDAIKAALSSPSDYTRRGAARVFAQYWYHMIGREDIARTLIQRVNDPDMLVRIESLKALWRWWYRTPDFTLRREIEQAFLARAAVEREHPLVRLNVAQAIYNILDDNTVQFHRNWLRSMALQKDRDRAEAARIAEVERPMAQELAAALRPDNPTARTTVLTALDYYFLRGGIGNDYDPITFYDPQAADTMAHAILPLLNSPDAQICAKALEALAVARDSGDRAVLLALFEHLGSSDKHTRAVSEQILSRVPSQYSAPPALASAPATPARSRGRGGR